MRWCGWTFLKHSQFILLVSNISCERVEQFAQFKLSSLHWFLDEVAFLAGKFSPTLLIHQLVFFRRIDNTFNLILIGWRFLCGDLIFDLIGRWRLASLSFHTPSCCCPAIVVSTNFQLKEILDLLSKACVNSESFFISLHFYRSDVSRKLPFLLTLKNVMKSKTSRRNKLCIYVISIEQRKNRWEKQQQQGNECQLFLLYDSSNMDPAFLNIIFFVNFFAKICHIIRNRRS